MDIAIALMLQRDPKHVNKDGTYKIDVIMKEAYDAAKVCLPKKKDVSTHTVLSLIEAQCAKSMKIHNLETGLILSVFK